MPMLLLEVARGGGHRKQGEPGDHQHEHGAERLDADSLEHRQPFEPHGRTEGHLCPCVKSSGDRRWRNAREYGRYRCDRRPIGFGIAWLTTSRAPGRSLQPDGQGRTKRSSYRRIVPAPR
jgi:hypothetical protein